MKHALTVFTLTALALAACAPKIETPSGRCSEDLGWLLPARPLIRWKPR